MVDFLDSIKDDAHTIYLLGDILDYWYEYRYVVPRGFVRFFGKLAELADSGVRIVWFIGNHDIWIFDYLPSELGIEVVDGALVEEIDGHFFYMTHGDGIGDSSHLSKYSASSSEAGGARRLSRRSIRAGPYLSPTAGAGIHAKSRGRQRPMPGA